MHVGHWGTDAGSFWSGCRLRGSLETQFRLATLSERLGNENQGDKGMHSGSLHLLVVFDCLLAGSDVAAA